MFMRAARMTLFSHLILSHILRPLKSRFWTSKPCNGWNGPKYVGSGNTKSHSIQDYHLGTPIVATAHDFVQQHVLCVFYSTKCKWLLKDSSIGLQGYWQISDRKWGLYTRDRPMYTRDGLIVYASFSVLFIKFDNCIKFHVQLSFMKNYIWLD